MAGSSGEWNVGRSVDLRNPDVARAFLLTAGNEDVPIQVPSTPHDLWRKDDVGAQRASGQNVRSQRGTDPGNRARGRGPKGLWTSQPSRRMVRHDRRPSTARTPTA
jgi:hypothetical protein